MKKRNSSSLTTTHLCLLFFLLPGIPLAATQSSTSTDNNDPNSQNLNQFNPSMLLIIVILLAALFLMGFFSIYIRHCADSPSNSVLPVTGAGGRSRRQPRGLDASVIETFPILDYSEVKIHHIGKEVLECAVCLCEFEDTETLRLIPKCDHVFHPECIDEWLSLHTTCPVCRADLTPQPVLEPMRDDETRDVEAQNDVVDENATEQQNTGDDRVLLPEPEVIPLSKTLNRNRTRRSRSKRGNWFPRSHSTGHSLVQPGQNTDRFTLRLPNEVRKQIMNREMKRASSLILLPRESSTRMGYRTGDGSSRGKRLDRVSKSDRWTFTMNPPFLVRTSSARSPKVRNSDGEGTSSSDPIMPATAVDSARPIV